MILSSAQTRIRDWLFRQALPLWAEAGIDAGGRFVERLDFDGRPITGLPRRTRVQARQVYVFAEAASLGWTEGEAVARRGFEVLVRDNRRDDGLWVRATDDAGVVIDSTPDLYDLAFVLFALAAAHRTLKDDRARPLALETLAAIEARMADPLHGGWQEALPPVLPRRQNPHMHMLEALLAWQALAPDPAFATAARRVLDLFATRFFDPSAAVLGEYFAADWAIAPGGAGQVIEPGHHMEWIWLLDQARRLGLEGHDRQAEALFASALTNGVDAQGLMIREVDRIGVVRDGGRRLWGQTEALRTLLLRGRTDRALTLLDAVFATHLATATPGLWIDSYDAQGRPQDASVPASTLYHLMTAFSALLTEPA
ncbi:N-acylglucosamine 2-epimerase [Brevundimonas naejangsanensis]|uniref:N-acylglucosamine 2-epimerase n=1 Tax=Brevundimonas naejangsanensis TaxID=588932 RepID=A0A494RL45_9CAUL|nr:AGE family epimerase/isomerase [Brevundimonas naejangsanensis]AYG94702.1 N-acylglucosamine 2-epimerase [Brevundimonas naejangsanensis]